MNRAIIADTETTSIKKPEVLHFAWAEMEELKVVGEIQEKFYSSKEPCEFGALATHHILPEDVAGMPLYDLGKFPSGFNYMVAHNVDFDWNALGKPKVKLICTLAIARKLYPKCDSHRLSALMYYLNGATAEVRESLTGAHNAKVDVQLLCGLLEHIKNDVDIHTLPNLYTFSEDSRIPSIMTFGKYKDQPIHAVDRGWYNWYRRQPDTDPYLLEAFKRAGF